MKQLLFSLLMALCSLTVFAQHPVGPPDPAPDQMIKLVSVYLDQTDGDQMIGSFQLPWWFCGDFQDITGSASTNISYNIIGDRVYFNVSKSIESHMPIAYRLRFSNDYGCIHQNGIDCTFEITFFV